MLFNQSGIKSKNTLYKSQKKILMTDFIKKITIFMELIRLTIV